MKEEQHCFSVGNAQCGKDNADLVRGTFGTLLNEEMKAVGDAKALKIWLHNNGEEGGGEGEGVYRWDDVKVTFGDHEEDVYNLANYHFYRQLPIELWIAGDLKWIAAAFGKENSSGHWCPWCLRSPKEWSGGDQDNYEGPYWDIRLLEEFAEGVSSGRLKSSAQRKGVVGKPVIDYVSPGKIAFPILHATLGFGNDWLKSFIKEMQAISEAYTTEYMVAEEVMGLTAAALEVAVQRLREYRGQVRDFVRESKKALRRKGANALGDVQRQMLTVDLEKIETEIARLQEDVDSCKESREASKATFE